MVRVAGDTPGKAHRVKHTLVRPGIEKLLLKHMAGGTDSLNRGNAWRGSTVAAVASRTRRGAQVSPNDECFMVDAGGIECELISRNLVAFHVVRIRMTMTTGLRHVERVNRRLRIVRGADGMGCMTIRADCHACVAFGQELPVYARLILAELIRTERRIETPHICSIGVALRAQRRDLAPLDMTLESGGRAHRAIKIIAGCVTTMAGRTRQPSLPVDAGGIVFRAHSERCIELCMAIEATVLGLCSEVLSD